MALIPIVETCNLMIKAKNKREMWVVMLERIDGKWMKCIKMEYENVEQPTPLQGLERVYILPIGRPMSYDGLPMGLGPD
ncbi:hypothetical protein Tco_0063104 [Tanacetum coccineum]